MFSEGEVDACDLGPSGGGGEGAAAGSTGAGAGSDGARWADAVAPEKVVREWLMCAVVDSSWRAVPGMMAETGAKIDKMVVSVSSC